MAELVKPKPRKKEKHKTASVAKNVLLEVDKEQLDVAEEAYTVASASRKNDQDKIKDIVKKDKNKTVIKEVQESGNNSLDCIINELSISDFKLENNEVNKEQLDVGQEAYTVASVSIKNDLDKIEDIVKKDKNKTVIKEVQESGNNSLDCIINEISDCKLENNEVDDGQLSLIAVTSGQSEELSYGILSEDLQTLGEEIEATAPPGAVPANPVAFKIKLNEISDEICNVEEGPLMRDLIESFSIEQEVTVPLKPLNIENNSHLYVNEELPEAVQYVEEFSKNDSPERDELFFLLTEYSRLKKTVKEDINKLESFSSSLDGSAIWTVSNNVCITERGLCGDGNQVILSHTYSTATFNQNAFEAVQSALNQSITHATTVKWQNEIIMELYKRKVDLIVWDIQNSWLTSHYVRSDISDMDSFTKKQIEQLCKTVATFFYFLRKISKEDDEEFVEEVKFWLSKVIIFLVRLGTWREQLFILCHVLCCPSDIASWAVQFVQCKAQDVNHACSVLYIILKPVARREVFLKCRVNGWVLVDEDYEDYDETEHVRENVLFALLAQVPLQEILKKYIIATRSLKSEMAMIQMLTFISSLVETLRCGLVTFCGNDHHQFRKQLGKLIRELVELATDELDLFVPEGYLSPRIQFEYDTFLLCATRGLLSAPPVWQFLAAMPFRRASVPARWQIYLDLILSDGTIVNQVDFATRLSLLPGAEPSYLLSALCNLALITDNSSKKLLRAVALHIFYVGFVHAATRDSVYKDAKCLLTLLLANNEYLLSELVGVNCYLLEEGELDDEGSQLELWQALPVCRWIPSDTDLALLTVWLSAPTSRNRNEIVRCILKSLNYDLIKREAQIAIARTVVRVSLQHAGDVVFSQFTWTLLCQLRLHAADGWDADLGGVPELSGDGELGLLVSQGVLPAVFLALATTSVGHFVPVIYNQGFKYVRLLFNDRHYEAAFVSIDYMTTMFWDCPDSLIACQDFISLLSDVVVVDDSYVKMAKNLIVNDRPGPILRKFAAMLHSQFERVGMEGLRIAVALWFRSLLSLPGWQNSAGALYLMDVVCRRAFALPSAWLIVLSGLESALLSICPVEPRSPLSFLRLGYSSSVPSLLPRGYSGSTPWFAFAAIAVEFYCFEQQTHLWKELLRELWNNRSKKTSIDGSLKKVCSNLKLPVRTSKELAFYRWAEQALDMSEGHPLTILVWQKLLELYVARVPGVADLGSPGACFFHGVTNSGLLKKLLTRLESLSVSQPGLASTFKAIGLWLSESMVLKANLLMVELPTQFKAPLLAELLSSECHQWYSLLPRAEMERDLTKDALAWSSVLGRVLKMPYLVTKTHSETSVIRIERRLKELGPPPIVLPKICPMAPVIPKIVLAVEIGRLLVDYIMPKNYVIEECIGSYQTRVNDLRALGAIICTTADQMYRPQEMSIRLNQKCNGVLKDKQNSPCWKPASVLFKFVQWKQDRNAHNSFYKALAELRSALPGIGVPQQLVNSCIFLEFISELFVKEALRTEFDSNLLALGLNFFELLLPLWQKADETCSGIAVLLERCLLNMAKSCVTERQEQSLDFLQYLFQYPKATFLHHQFTPYASGVKFVHMYKLVCNKSAESLLSRFDVAMWLHDATLKSSTRSKLLAIIFATLKSPNTTTDVHMILHEHLKLMTLHKFPEHYGEVLLGLIDGENSISPDSWYCFINALAPPGLTVESLSPKSLEVFFSRFAAEQTLLGFDILQDTTVKLGDKWRGQRVANGPLYTNYGKTAEALFAFLGAIAHSLVVRLLADQKGLLSDEIVSAVWPLLESLFGPWLLPIVLGPTTIQQPFTENDAKQACLVATIFVESLRFLSLSLSGSTAVLSHSLQFYTKHFCLEGVDCFLLAIIHSSLATLPWYNLQPTLLDVEAIVQVVNKCIPLCHSFLGNVFVSVDWSAVSRRSLSTHGTEVNARLHGYLLQLFVKFPSEPSLRMNKVVEKIIDTSIEGAWHLVDAESYRTVIDWFVKSCNPNVVLAYLRAQDRHELDVRILRLLQIAAGYDVSIQYFHPTTPAKRQMYVEALVKCLANAASKDDSVLARVEKFTARVLTDIETIVPSTVPEHLQVDEANMLLSEFLRLLSESKLVVPVKDALFQWLKNERGSLVTTALLCTAGRVIDNPVDFGDIAEITIETHFALGGRRDWQFAALLLAPYAGGTMPMEQLLLRNECYLTLYAVILRRLGFQQWSTEESRFVLTLLLQMFASVRATKISEPKLVLLAGMALMLTATQTDAAAMLKTLSESLAALSADRGGGFLNTIGLKKATTPSIMMKLCCITMSAGISNILVFQHSHVSDDKYIQILDRAENNKQFLPVMAHILTVKRDLENVNNYEQLLTLTYSTAAQLFNKLYFVSLS